MGARVQPAPAGRRQRSRRRTGQARLARGPAGGDRGCGRPLRALLRRQAVARCLAQGEIAGARFGAHPGAGAPPLERAPAASTMAGDSSWHHAARPLARARKCLALSGRIRVAPGLWNGSRPLAGHAALGVLRPRTRPQEGEERTVELVDDVAPHRWRHTRRGTGTAVRRRTASSQTLRSGVRRGHASARQPRARRAAHKVELAEWLLDLVRRGKAPISRMSSGHSPGCSAEYRSTLPPRRSFRHRWWKSSLRESRHSTGASPVCVRSLRCLRPRAGAPTSGCSTSTTHCVPRVAEKLGQAGAKDEQIRCVLEYREVSAADRNDLFGEQLPAGLRLVTA